MKKLTFLLLVISFTLSKESLAQFPPLPGFMAQFNFWDPNTNQWVGHLDACIGETVTIQNVSHYGINSNGSGAWPIGTHLVDGHYIVRTTVSGSPGVYFRVEAVDWPYNSTKTFVVPNQVISHPSGGGGVLNFEIRYYQDWLNNSGATVTDPSHRVRKRVFHTLPQPSFFASASPSSICPGGSSSLSVPGNWSSIQWSTGATSSSINVSPTSPTTYSVTVTNGGGCTSSNNVSVGILNDNLTVSSEYYICGNNYPTICPPEANSSTQWYYSSGQSFMLVNTGSCFQPTETGNYTIIQSNPCFAMESFDLINVTGQLNPLFTPSAFHLGSYYSLTANAVQTSFPSNVSNIGFFWLVEDLTTGCVINNYSKWWGGAYPATANAFTNNFPEFNPLQGSGCSPDASYNQHGRFEYGHTYKIIRGLWSDCDGWTASSTTISVGMPPMQRDPNGIQVQPQITYQENNRILTSEQEIKESIGDIIFNKNSTLEEQFKPFFDVYPNPTNGYFTVNLEDDQVSEVQIWDISGKLLVSKQMVGKRIKFDINDQPNGIYLLKVISSETVETKRIVKK